MSDHHIGEGNPMFGMLGKLSPMFGKHHSIITKKKMSEKAIGRKQSDETKKKKSVEMIERYNNGWAHPMTNKKNTSRSELNKQQVGDKNPFYEKHHTNEAKTKISNANKGEKNGMYGKKYSIIERQFISKKLKEFYKNKKINPQGEMEFNP